MRIPFAIVVTTLAVLATAIPPASAASGITDPCGDAQSRAYGLGEQVVAEDSLGHVDLAGGGVAPVLDEEGGVLLGLEATVQVCGEASATDGGYSISWGVGDGCHQQLGWTLLARDDVSAATRRPGQDEVDVATGPRAILQEYCFVATPGNPVRANEVQTIFRVGLPAEAFAFEGDSLRFDIPLDLIPAEGTVPALGDVLTYPTAIAMDQTVSMFTFGGSSTFGSSGAWVRTDVASGPSVTLART